MPLRQLSQLRTRGYRVPHQRFSVRTSDGVTLRGVHLRRGHQTVCVYCHGFLSSKNLKAVPGFVEALSERFDVVAFDFRGHGDSGGRCSFTALEVLDLDAVVGYVRQHGYERIILIGSSMGGATAIRYAGLYGGVDGVVTIGAFASSAQFRYPSTQRSLELCFRPPFGPTYARLFRNTRIGALAPIDAQPVDVVGRIQPPILFIHGEWDLLVHPDEARALHENASAPKDIVIVPRGGHDMPLLTRTTRDLIARWAESTLHARSVVTPNPS